MVNMVPGARSVSAVPMQKNCMPVMRRLCQKPIPKMPLYPFSARRRCWQRVPGTASAAISSGSSYRMRTRAECSRMRLTAASTRWDRSITRDFSRLGSSLPKASTGIATIIRRCSLIRLRLQLPTGTEISWNLPRVIPICIE